MNHFQGQQLFIRPKCLYFVQASRQIRYYNFSARIFASSSITVIHWLEIIVYKSI